MSKIGVDFGGTRIKLARVDGERVLAEESIETPQTGGPEVVLSAMAVARVVCSPVWGHVADVSLGRRRVLQLGTVAGAALALVLFVVGEDAWWVAAVSVAMGAAMCTTGPTIDAIALDHLGEEDLTDYGRLRGWGSLTYGLANFLFGATFEVIGVGWSMPFFAAFCTQARAASGELVPPGRW